MNMYRFSPIETEQAFHEALGYIAQKVGDLSVAVCGTHLPVTILKVFAHDDDEYQLLEGFVQKHGTKAAVSSERSFYVTVTSGLAIEDVPIKLLGVRKPDPTRPEVGCGDYEIEDFDAYAGVLLSNNPDFTFPVQNAHGTNMVELRHPDFDVLEYVIHAKE